MYHCRDNVTMLANYSDKLYKIRPVLDSFSEKVSSTVPSETLSIDERVVPFKRASSLWTYNPKKPKKWGYKIFLLSGVNGVVYNFKIYTGSVAAVPGQADHKASDNIMLDLLQLIPRVWHKVYFDNWFNSPALQATL